MQVFSGINCSGLQDDSTGSALNSSGLVTKRVKTDLTNSSYSGEPVSLTLPQAVEASD